MRSLPAGLLPLVLVACGSTSSTPPAQEAPRASSPAETGPASAEWEVATKGATEKDAACSAVREALTAEKSCSGPLCAHGASLAKEWSKRCGGDAAVASELATRAKQPPSQCAASAQAVLQKGCANDPTCENTVGRWGARCGKAEGSPLVLGLLARVVAKRSVLTEFSVDTRGCDELLADMRSNLACTRATCRASLKKAQAYRTRCEGQQGEVPDAVTALIETAIFTSAGQVTAPTMVRPDPPKLTPADMPVLLPDHRSAIASICEERPADLEGYAAMRHACENGKIVVVRTFINSAKEYDVRAGIFDAPDDETFARRFPTLRALGEIEARDAVAKKALETELPKIAAWSKLTASDAARGLVKLVHEHGAAIVRSASVRAAFAAVDADLAAAMAKIGEAKLDAADEKLSSADLAGLAARAPTRPFADLGEDGAVSIGAATGGARVDGASILPKAMEAYLAALGNLSAIAKKKKLSTKDAGDAKRGATDAAKACGAAAKRAQVSERDLIACAFTMNTCAPEKIQALTRSLDEDRGAMATARHKIDMAASMLPALTRASLEKAGAACAGP